MNMKFSSTVFAAAVLSFAIVLVAGVFEKTAPRKVPKHSLHGSSKNASDLVRREMGQLVEQHMLAELAIDAI